MSFINHLFSKETRNKPVTYNSHSSGALFFGQYDNGSAMSLSAVFGAVDIISNSIAELPIQVKKRNANDCYDVIDNHYINKLFDNCTMSRFNLMKQLITDMLLHGNSYVYILRDTKGQPVSLTYLRPNSVTINYQQSTGVLKYQVTGYKNVPSIVKPKDILHFYKNSIDGINGRGILAYANRTITIGNYTEEAAKDYFGSGCGIKGILKFNEQILDIDKDEIRKNWQQVHGGSDASGLAICDYNVDFIPVSQNASDSQMIESRLYNTTDIARFFGISPVLLQDLSHSSYNTIEAAQLEFLTHTLLPYISLCECEMNRKLGDDSIWIDLAEEYLMTTDKNAKANYIKNLLSTGVICVNEARKMIGLPPIDGGDKHFVAFTKIEDNTIEGTDKKESE